MPNKRFLGLGFTFTATDKGLEKKLTSVSNLLGDISGELDVVNKKFKGFEALLKSAEVPEMGAVPVQTGRPKPRKTVEQPRRKSNPVQTHRRRDIIPVVVTNFKEIKNLRGLSAVPTQNIVGHGVKTFSFDEELSSLDKLSDSSKLLFAGIRDSLAKFGSTETTFIEAISKEKFSLDQLNNLSLESQQKLIDLSKAQDVNIKANKTIFDDFSKGFKKVGDKIQLVIAKTQDYFSEVGNSFGELLGTLGIRLHDIIPPQFMAAGKLLKTIVATPLKGLASGAKKLLTKPSQATQKLRSGFKKEIDKINHGVMDISKKLGKNTKTDSIFAKTSELVDLTKEKNDEGKKGILGTLFDWIKKLLFSPFTLLGLAASLAGKALWAIFHPISAVGKVFETIGAFLQSNFLKTLIQIGSKFGEIVAAVVVFGAAIYGFVQGILATKEEWASFFTGIGDLAKSVWGLIKSIWESSSTTVASFLSLSPALDAVVQTLKDFASALIDIPVWIVKHIASGFENISGWLGVGAGMAGKAMSAFSKTVDQTTQAISQPPVMATQDVNKVTDLRASADTKQQTDASKASDTTVALMAQQTDVLNQILNALQRTPPGGTNNMKVNITSDARKQGFALQQQELNNHGLAGQ